MRRFFQLVAVVLAVMSCSPFKVVLDYDKNIDFSRYKTYTLNLEELQLNDIDESRVTSELQNQLVLKNILPSENFDLEIKVRASHEKVRNSYIMPSVGFGSWGYWFGGVVDVGRTIVSEYNQGSLVFDFIDAKTGKLVWQGVGSGIKVDSPKSKQEQIPDIIAKMLKNFPPRK